MTLDEAAFAAQLMGAVRDIVSRKEKNDLASFNEPGTYLNPTFGNIGLTIKRLEISQSNLDIQDYFAMGFQTPHCMYPVDVLDIIISRKGFYLVFQGVEVQFANYLEGTFISPKDQFSWIKLCVAGNKDLQEMINTYRRNRVANKKNGK